MRIQSVGNNDCQRKKDVSFEALLMKKNAFRLVDAFFPKVLSSASDGAWGLKPHQHKEFRDLFLTPQESQKASSIGCGEGNPKGVYDYFVGLKEKAMKSGIYTVSKIREAVRNGTFYQDSNFVGFSPVKNLQAKVEKYCNVGGILQRTACSVFGAVINRKVVPDCLV